jgi:hypothetical protein
MLTEIVLGVFLWELNVQHYDLHFFHSDWRAKRNADESWDVKYESPSSKWADGCNTGDGKSERHLSLLFASYCTVKLKQRNGRPVCVPDFRNNTLRYEVIQPGDAIYRAFQTSLCRPTRQVIRAGTKMFETHCTYEQYSRKEIFWATNECEGFIHEVSRGTLFFVSSVYEQPTCIK